jgi:hypothetical protein
MGSEVIGEVELNAFVQSFQSGTECGQIGLAALVLAEKAPDAVFDANLVDWMRQFDHWAMVQAINRSCGSATLVRRCCSC